MKPVNIGICGLGTVGAGVYNVFKRNRNEICARAGHDIRITHVGARRDNPACDTSSVIVERDILDVARADDVDIVIELIGGCDIAKTLVLLAIENGKHVITANKALIALHGNEIFQAAKEKNVGVYYEASVAGGIPIVKAIREGLAANRIQWLAGIINGTGNYILTEMRDKGRSFDDALKDAQALGYAEADPSFDVDGIDACHKLVILASLAFAIPLQFDKAFIEGIRHIEPQDVEYAEELGYRITHLGIAKRTNHGVELRVHPTLVPEQRLLANVDGVMNAVLVNSDAVGSTLYYGPGAGSEPTASSVIADMVDLVRFIDAEPHSRVPSLAFHPGIVDVDQVVPLEDIEVANYLRMQVADEPGVMANVTQLLSENNINIEAMIQKEPNDGENEVPLIILTNSVKESHLQTALTSIKSLETVKGNITQIRMESLK